MLVMRICVRARRSCFSIAQGDIVCRDLPPASQHMQAGTCLAVAGPATFGPHHPSLCDTLLCTA
jgi:hypothetical protein